MQKVRTVIYFEPQIREALEKISAKTGAPVGELVRRAVDEYLARQERRSSK
jgi:hypothetical protein